MSKSEPKLITVYVCPPIPTRQFDWCCYEVGEEESGDYGWGRLEEDAIHNWKFNYGDYE